MYTYFVHLGERISRWRSVRGWSQREMARRLGISHTSVNAWEHDRKYPCHRHLARLCDLLGVSLGTFYSVLPDVEGDSGS